MSDPQLATPEDIMLALWIYASEERQVRELFRMWNLNREER